MFTLQSGPERESMGEHATYVFFYFFGFVNFGLGFVKKAFLKTLVCRTLVSLFLTLQISSSVL